MVQSMTDHEMKSWESWVNVILTTVENGFMFRIFTLLQLSLPFIQGMGEIRESFGDCYMMIKFWFSSLFSLSSQPDELNEGCKGLCRKLAVT